MCCKTTSSPSRLPPQCQFIKKANTSQNDNDDQIGEVKHIRTYEPTYLLLPPSFHGNNPLTPFRRTPAVWGMKAMMGWKPIEPQTLHWFSSLCDVSSCCLPAPCSHRDSADLASFGARAGWAYCPMDTRLIDPAALHRPIPLPQGLYPCACE